MSHPQANPPNPEILRLCREAEEAWKRLDFQASLKLLEQASAAEPSNVSLLIHLARGYSLRYDYAAAKRCLDKALQFSHGHPKILEQAIVMCSSFKNLDYVMSYLERANQKKGSSVAGLIGLADIYLIDNRLDDAAEMISRARRMDRKDPRVVLRAAILRRERGQGEEAAVQFRELLANTAVETFIRIRAAYQLAAILDTAGQYDEAMSALLEGKALQRPQALPLATALQQMQVLNRDLPKIITASVLDRWRADAANLQPPRRIALLTGHPRSGTTLVEQMLDSHSDAVSMEEMPLIHDEVFVPIARGFPSGTSFLQMLDSSPPSVINRWRENYFHCADTFLGQPGGNRMLVDKNPGSNFIVPVLLRICPEAKFLVALRDPRDVVMSCFMQALTMTAASSAYLSLEGTVKQYASTMAFWQEMLPRLNNQWMYVRYEEMVDDLPKVARSALDFLGLGFEENVLKFYEHARAKRVNSPTYADVRKPTYKTAIGRWKNYEKYLEPYLTGLEPFLKEFNYR